MLEFFNYQILGALLLVQKFRSSETGPKTILRNQEKINCFISLSFETCRAAFTLQPKEAGTRGVLRDHPQKN